ncbi:NHLP bacteriocin export ABC transporter permease/ATPase subunit [Halorhodospira abdelmalekii]|uniref:NHLP bacteriocin export ABC transporter permease/ATPase subunit n=1 Tax=Halorhodospira abdelmalekii TaxID=421629 RepID=UPI001902F200|nr:NHLP bacteriocin export ABC transporter permease/ATPase subunit [Halorhodospira abdelmalekii]MBK1735237.1 NHLP bacteriocin export ABC transporter permease/ATPase subunit [Halorhodospira abdelmalekii]
MSILAKLFEKLGTDSTLTAHDRLWLDQSERGPLLYRVSQGEVDVYLAWRDQEGAPGRRHYIGTCTVGMVIPAWSEINASGWQLQLTGQLNTHLQSVFENQLGEDDEQIYVELAEALNNWLMLLYKPLRGRLPPDATKRIKPDEAGQLGPDESGVVTGRGNWVALGQGSGSVCAYGTQAITIQEDDYPLLLPPGGWVKASHERAATIWLIDTESLLENDPEMESYVSANEQIIAGLATHFKDVELLERQRMQQRVETEKAVMSGGLQTLAAVLRRKYWRPEFRPEEAPWLGACRMVSEYSGIQFKDPGPGVEESRDPLAMVERTNGLRYRLVALEREWWKSDNGPMLGYWQDGSPVALVPRKNRRSYEVCDPSTKKVSRVDRKIDSDLMDRAYTFYRPFGDIKPSPAGVLKFAVAGLRRDFLMFLCAAALAVLLGFFVPVATGILVDDIIPGADRDRIFELMLLLIALAFSGAFFEITKGLTQLRLEGRMETVAQSAVWDKLLRLPASFFRNYSAGDLADRANAFAEMRRVISGTTLATFVASFFSLFALVLMLVYSPLLTVVVIGLAFFALALNIISTAFSLVHERRMAESSGILSGMTLELLSGVGKIRANGAEQRAFSRWSQAFARQQEHAYRAGAMIRPVTALETALPLLSTAVIFFVVARMDPEEGLTVGQFVAFNAAQGMFLGGVLGLSQLVASLIGLVPLWERAKPILVQPEEVDSGKSEPGRLAGHIEVCDVEFAYGEDSPQILRGTSLNAEPGEFIGIVGTSGSGKSTLLRLMLGFETPQAGSVFYDGQDMAGLDLTALRKQVGVVLQDGYLMQGDIFSNIIGSAPLTPADAWEAVRMAGMENDIKNMPMGLYTMVSEGGTTLSGGQRQRLLIARALVHRPRILFFDEATSALDNKTQAQVNESVEQLEATRIVIAHRLSTIVRADRICVMDAGRVAESGSYDELIAQNGIFAELARRQVA